MKKILSLVLTGIFVFGGALPTFASEKITDNNTQNQVGYSVYSEEFPDAYIVTSISGNNKSKNADSTIDLGTVTATVYVEEDYGFVDGKTIVTDSRLLSKDEVEAIGEDNFDDLNSESSTPDKNSRASNSRGKLTISLSGTTNTSGNGVICNIGGLAKWDGFNFIVSPENNPAVGSDYCGFAWSGGFSASNSTASATLDNGGVQKVYLSESTPNSGRVWEFNEYSAINSYKNYVKLANFGTKLSKSKLEGNGNKAEAVMKYIHTYQSTTGSISISASSSGIGSGFSLSNTSKQWSISATLTGIPY